MLAFQPISSTAEQFFWNYADIKKDTFQISWLENSCALNGYF
jgi:hypothetical protein